VQLNCTYSIYTDAAPTCSAAQQHSPFNVQILCKFNLPQLNYTYSNITKAVAKCSPAQQHSTFSLTLPKPLTATHQNLCVNIIDLEVLFQTNFLVYVIRLPLTNHVKYIVYHVLPLPIRIEDDSIKFCVNITGT